MKAADMTREQLIEELARVRQEVSGIAHQLNNTLVGVLGNVSMAKLYHVSGGDREKVTLCLKSAEDTFLDVRKLTQRMFDIALDGNEEATGGS